MKNVWISENGYLARSFAALIHIYLYKTAPSLNFNALSAYLALIVELVFTKRRRR